jgi:ABC-type phosphate transport system substrate-binding protein
MQSDDQNIGADDGSKGTPVRKSNFVKLAVIGVAASTFPLVGAGQAFGDYAPQPGDIVGVGGDTPQYALDFALNGDAAGDAGFDQQATVNRVVSFLATPDSNGRSAYTNSVTTGAASTSLYPTDVLRAGTTPTPRVSSSGGAISAFLLDTGATEQINFISSASLPTSTQQSAAASAGWGYLHVVEIGTDSVQIAVDSTATNAPSGLSAAELLGIYNGTYTTWNQLPGNSAGSTATIVPDIPPSTSSIYKTFIADLTTANDGTAPTLAADVKTVEQNDPTVITGSSSSANVIVPFSAGRLNLWNSGYFHSPNNGTWGLPSSLAVLTPGVKLLTGTPGDSGAVYASPITDYVIFRNSDAASTTPLEPGGTKNWVQTLFSDPGGSPPFFDRAAGQTLLTAAGITPDYDDLGDA